ncbi:MAG: PIG-L family deacetylase [Chthoniobacteraceae bacterium]|nr:PIG-L family deacetylase [Chthoniobacteraceae bacterium]
MSFSFSPADRLLLIMPHPDDESLATGGLIQRIRQAGATARLLMVTNGENNPWPQRWLEKRWRIGPAESKRWGAMRAEEAREALARLGFPGEARFLGFPDQGMTPRLLQADPATMERLCAEICEWQPTRVVCPSSYDLHPDHNALYVLVQIALQRTGFAALPQLRFVVHCKRPGLIPCRAALSLTEAERQLKREAILCHTTQMVLSRKRFAAYARPQEVFFEPAPVEPFHPNLRIPDAFLNAGALNLGVTLPPRLGRGAAIWIAGESPSKGSLRWRLPLSGATGKVSVEEIATGRPLAAATVRIAGQVARIKIPVASAAPFSRLFVKFHRRTIFLDDAGWREVPVGRS